MVETSKLYGNPRYANYARIHGRTPEKQLEQDRRDWPGGVMIGFAQWNRMMMRRFCNFNPDAFFMGNLIDHKAYDAWLSAQKPE